MKVNIIKKGDPSKKPPPRKAQEEEKKQSASDKLNNDDQVDISSDELEEVQTTAKDGAKDVEMQDQELKMPKKRKGVEQAQDASVVIEKGGA